MLVNELKIQEENYMEVEVREHTRYWSLHFVGMIEENRYERV